MSAMYATFMASLHMLNSSAPEVIITFIWQKVHCNYWLIVYVRALHNITFTESCILDFWRFITFVVEQVQSAEMLLSHCFGNGWGLWVLYAVHCKMKLYCCIVNFHSERLCLFLLPTIPSLCYCHFTAPDLPRYSHSPQYQLHVHTPWAGQAHIGSCSKSVGGGGPPPRGGVMWHMQIRVWSPSGGKSRSPQQVGEGWVWYWYCRED